MTTTILVRPTVFSFTLDKWADFAKTHGVQVIYDQCLSTQELVSKIENKQDGYDQINIFAGMPNFYKLDAAVFDKLPLLKAVCFCSAGYDQIDFKEATRRGIHVLRVYDLDTSTADTNLFLLLGAMRFYQQSIKDLYIRREFKNPEQVGVAPNGLTLGIIGLGAIGKQVAARCKPLGFGKTLYYNRLRAPVEVEQELGVEYVSSADELVSRADVVDLNCALTKETYHLINEERILKMKDGVIIINTSRGDVIDETALIKYLKNGKILSAGLDVFHNEPNINFDLAAMDNVIALPHVGSYSKATRVNAQLTVFKNAEHFLETGKLLSYIGEQKDLYK